MRNMYRSLRGFYFSLLLWFFLATFHFILWSYIRACTQSLIEWLRYNWIIQRWQCEYRTSLQRPSLWRCANPTSFAFTFWNFRCSFSSFACIFYIILYLIDHRVTLEWHLNASEYLRTCLASYQIATQRYIERERGRGRVGKIFQSLACLPATKIEKNE